MRWRGEAILVLSGSSGASCPGVGDLGRNVECKYLLCATPAVPGREVSNAGALSIMKGECPD